MIPDRLYTPEPMSGCWLWLATVHESGYGLYIKDYVTVRAHRWSYELHHNIKIPDGLFVCHKCDTPQGINPAHLFLGNHKDNGMDASRKGRTHKIIGTDAHNAKLDEAKVREIRASNETQEALAARYGVARSTIGRVRSGYKWKHIT